eukprot:839134-Amphidinium_carterae.1
MALERLFVKKNDLYLCFGASSLSAVNSSKAVSMHVCVLSALRLWTCPWLACGAQMDCWRELHELMNRMSIMSLRCFAPDSLRVRFILKFAMCGQCQGNHLVVLPQQMARVGGLPRSGLRSPTQPKVRLFERSNKGDGWDNFALQS